MPTLSKVQNNNPAHFQKGFTAIELGVTLLILAVLTVGVVKGVAPLLGEAKMHNMSNALSQLTVNTTKLSLSGNYGSDVDLNPALIASNKVPGEFTVTGNVITHGAGGVVTATGKVKLYSLNITGLIKEDCIGVIASNSSGYERVIVDTSATAPASVTTGGVVPPIDASGGVSLCSAATGNVIHFVSR